MLRLALRDLKGGFSGFRIFLACIALGVAAITGVGSVSDGLSDGLARESRTILGGDVSLSLIHRELAPDERAFILARGTISTFGISARWPGAKMVVRRSSKPRRSMRPIRRSERSHRARRSRGRGARLAGRPFGLIADPALSATLDIKLGDTFFIGEQSFQLRALLQSEPDKLAGGIGFGPRVLISKRR